MKKAVLLLVVLAACGRPPVTPQFDFSAATPTPADFSSENDLLTRWPGTLLDFWNQGEAGTFDGVGGVKIAYRIHRVPNAKAGVVILPGRTEAIIKFAEVARDLTNQGYSTYALTVRGQGEAGRILSDHDKGYVDFFEDYVTDTHQFISTIVKPEQPKVFVLAHSMSGAIATLLVHDFPEDVAALATTSPMLDINLGAFPPPVAATLAGGICSASDGSGYTIGAGPYEPETKFEGNSVTQSLNRWQWKIDQLKADDTLHLGGVTWRWLCQALDGSSRAQGSGPSSSTPTLMFIAGKDTIVKPAGQQRYCGQAPRCTLVTLDDAKHEILQERDDLRNDAMTKIVKFFDAQVTP